MDKVLDIQRVKDLCTLQQLLAETETADVCGISSRSGIHLSAKGFKQLFGQGEAEPYPIDAHYTHRHWIVVDGVTVFCIGGETL